MSIEIKNRVIRIFQGSSRTIKVRFWNDGKAVDISDAGYDMREVYIGDTIIADQDSTTSTVVKDPDNTNGLVIKLGTAESSELDVIKNKLYDLKAVVWKSADVNDEVRSKANDIIQVEEF